MSDVDTLLQQDPQFGTTFQHHGQLMMVVTESGRWIPSIFKDHTGETLKAKLVIMLTDPPNAANRNFGIGFIILRDNWMFVTTGISDETLFSEACVVRDEWVTQLAAANQTAAIAAIAAIVPTQAAMVPVFIDLTEDDD